MTALHLASISSLWLGLLTSMSPCPLATNIAAVGFVGRDMTRPKAVLLDAAAYTAGRMLTYVALAFILATGALAIPDVSFFLEKYANSVLGTVLLLAGMFILDMLRLDLPDFNKSAVAKSLAATCGAGAPFFMGAAFALAFCPISGAIYFGSLLPLTIKAQSPLLVPAVYAIGTALPVTLVSVLISAGAKSVGETFSLMTAFENKARRATGIIFIITGIYLTLKYAFRWI